MPNSLFFYNIYASLYDESMNKLSNDFEMSKKVRYFSEKFIRPRTYERD